MSILGNDDIARHVETLIREYTKNVKIRPEDKHAIIASKELVINFLQNLNDLAYAASNIDTTIANRS